MRGMVHGCYDDNDDDDEREEDAGGHGACRAAGSAGSVGRKARWMVGDEGAGMWGSGMIVWGGVRMATCVQQWQRVGVTEPRVGGDDDDDGGVVRGAGRMDQQGAGCGCEGRGVRYVVSGRRVTEQQARAHAAAGGVVCAVPQLTGGGCGMSVSFLLQLATCMLNGRCACKT